MLWEDKQPNLTEVEKGGLFHTLSQQKKNVKHSVTTG